MTRRNLLLLVWLVVANCSAHTQSAEPPASGATGTVLGLLLDSDSKLPIRFAHIVLLPVPRDVAIDSVVQNSQQRLPRFRMAEAESGLDGEWRVENLPPGDYLIGAFQFGYVAPASTFHPMQSDAQKHAMIASIPSVHVVAGDTTSVTTMLSKGGVISGRIVFPDGSPATGIAVSAEPSDQLANSQALQNSMKGSGPGSPLDQTLGAFKYGQPRQPVITDERGRYRIGALAAGKYLIAINVTHSDRPSRLVFDNSTSHESYVAPELIPVFAPGVVLHSEARQFEIVGRDEVTDADIMIDFHALHTIRGTATRAGESHPTSNCMVRLHVDSAIDFGRFTTCAADGTFTLHDLPSGHYRIGIFSSDIDRNPSQFYQADEMKVVVADQDILLGDIPLKALKPGTSPDMKLF